MGKKCFISKEYLGQTTFLRPCVPQKAHDCFFRQSSGSQEAQFPFFLCTTGWKGFGSRQVLRELFFDNFRHLEKFGRSRHLHQSTLLHILFNPFLNSSVIQNFQGGWTLDNAEIYLKTLFLFRNFQPKSCGKIRKPSAENWMQPTLQIPPPN